MSRKWPSDRDGFHQHFTCIFYYDVCGLSQKYVRRCKEIFVFIPFTLFLAKDVKIKSIAPWLVRLLMVNIYQGEVVQITIHNSVPPKTREESRKAEHDGGLESRRSHCRSWAHGKSWESRRSVSLMLTPVLVGDIQNVTGVRSITFWLVMYARGRDRWQS